LLEEKPAHQQIPGIAAEGAEPLVAPTSHLQFIRVISDSAEHMDQPLRQASFFYFARNILFHTRGIVLKDGLGKPITH